MDFYQHKGTNIYLREGVSLPRAYKDESGKGYLYLVYVGPQRLLKIGTSCNPEKRFADLGRYYNSDVEVLWVSPVLSKWTTLRVEEAFKEKLRWLGWKWHRQDRFEVYPGAVAVEVKVRNTYTVYL